MSDPTPDIVANHVDAVAAGRMQAVARLGLSRPVDPELKRAEALARLDLVAAIMAMDDAEGVPGRHNLNEQAAVEMATQAYAQALADLVRGQKD